MQAIASTSFLGQAMPVSAKAARQAADVKVTATFKKGGKRVAKKASKAAKPAGSAGWLGAGKDAALAKWYGPDRKLFLPPGLYDSFDVPSYLNGELAGDYGYDVLSVSKDENDVAKYRAFEVLHARWAMLGAAGMIIPEGLAANGADIAAPVWFETGAGMLNNGTLNYFAVPFKNFDNPLPLVVVVAAEVALMGFAEKYRSEGTGPQGYAPGVGSFDSDVFSGLDELNPGGPFDPLGLADDPETFAELKVKEIKNGRLAMMATLGFFVQAPLTGEGPYANWAKHVADPFGYNIITILQGDRTPIDTLL
mmetsp:Transcript_57680/g.182658  ORF Transcript_57680/g.182658 Transcript_57680/m.182658 type:complete len:308 (+) Transcript_57680:605-1528(+)